MHKVREDAKVIIDDEETLNLEDWINIFHGPPCNVDSMVELVQDSNKRGKFLPPKEETPEGITYANANQTVRVVSARPSVWEDGKKNTVWSSFGGVVRRTTAK